MTLTQAMLRKLVADMEYHGDGTGGREDRVRAIHLAPRNGSTIYVTFDMGPWGTSSMILNRNGQSMLVPGETVVGA